MNANSEVEQVYSYSEVRGMPNGTMLTISFRGRSIQIQLVGNLLTDTSWKARILSTGRVIRLERYRNAEFKLLNHPEILSARMRLHPSMEVVRNSMPGDIECRIRDRLQREGFRPAPWQQSTAELIFLVRNQYPAALDHPGLSRDKYNRPVFVGEPYSTKPDIHEQAAAFAGRFSLRMNFSMDSWHFPGKTVRFEFALEG